MSEHTCFHPGCTATEESATLYKEPTPHNDRGWFPICGQHADFDKDGIEVLDGPAAELSAEILAALKNE